MWTPLKKCVVVQPMSQKRDMGHPFSGELRKCGRLLPQTIPTHDGGTVMYGAPGSVLPVRVYRPFVRRAEILCFWQDVCW